jgi:hypothetical protein
LLDDISFSFFKKKKLKNVTYCRLNELEGKNLELEKVKKTRSTIEYYFTLSPYVPIFFQNKFDLKKINYLDVDIFFFKNPELFYNLTNKYSITLIKQKANAKYGNYNVGWISYNFLEKDTIKILNDWKNKCKEWCYDRVENNLYADQKYLDIWPSLSKKIKILEPKYTMISPWDIDCMSRVSSNNFYSFHFHGLTLYKNFFISGLSRYQNIKDRDVLKSFYIKYVELLNLKSKELNFSSKISLRYSASESLNYFYKLNLLIRKIKFIFFSMIRFDFFRIKN